MKEASGKGWSVLGGSAREGKVVNCSTVANSSRESNIREQIDRISFFTLLEARLIILLPMTSRPG